MRLKANLVQPPFFPNSGLQAGHEGDVPNLWSLKIQSSIQRGSVHLLPMGLSSSKHFLGPFQSHAGPGPGLVEKQAPKLDSKST